MPWTIRWSTFAMYSSSAQGAKHFILPGIRLSLLVSCCAIAQSRHRVPAVAAVYIVILCHKHLRPQRQLPGVGDEGWHRQLQHSFTATKYR